MLDSLLILTHCSGAHDVALYIIAAVATLGAILTRLDRFSESSR